MIGHIAWQAFYWPGGALIGNLLASMVWQPAILRKVHKTHKLTGELHASHFQRAEDKTGDGEAVREKEG